MSHTAVPKEQLEQVGYKRLYEQSSLHLTQMVELLLQARNQTGPESGLYIISDADLEQKCPFIHNLIGQIELETDGT